MGQVITKDIKFDRYGDIEFFGNDIDVISDGDDILYQNVIDRLITNFNDYELDPQFGADISSSIGSRNDYLLEVKIKNKVFSSLTSDGFLDGNEVVITSARENEKIHLRISIVSTFGKGQIEIFKINTIFNTSSGLLYATN